MLPDPSHPRWRALVLGTHRVQFRMLAAKLMMGRIILEIDRSPTDDTITAKIREVHEFFSKNEATAQDDIRKVFAQEAL
jgi:hypothetical protein